MIYQGDVDVNSAAVEVDISMLSLDQLRAFTIVCDHFTHRGAGRTPPPPQLLMQIQGEGRTGKSLVIKKVTKLFKVRGKESHLRCSAYTGIAALLIEGSTPHQLALLHKAGKGLSNKSIACLREIWGSVEYLIIDEPSPLATSLELG